MIRYLALVWDDTRPDLLFEAHAHQTRILQRQGWTLVLQSPGLIVCCMHTRANDAERLYVLDEQHGVIIGRLFEHASDSQSHEVTFDAHRSRALADTDGLSLSQSYWGRYVAFVRGRQRRTTILRDPSGNIACFQAALGDVQVFFSRLADFIDLTAMPFSIDWHYVAGFLLYPGMPKRSTGLREVSQLLPGECVTLGVDGNRRAFHWNPLKIATEAHVEDPAEATQLLFTTTTACVHAWASCYPRILHLLSGGLDSSIVAACLTSAPTNPEVVAVNYYSEGADSDERGYARAAASRAGFELVEIERNANRGWEQLFTLGPSPYPSAFIGNIETGRPLAELARHHGATARFSGTGGDLLFYSHSGYLAAADHIYDKGLTSDTFSVALDAACVDRSSVWKVLVDGVRYGVLKRCPRLIPEVVKERSLMPLESLAAAETDEDMLHPLYRNGYPLPRGKLNQAHTTTFALESYYSPLEQSDDPDHVAPLFSQPLVELCLRIPTYVLMNNGRDRAIARDAFAEQLPRQIFLRKSKGGVENHVKNNLFRNIKIVRELLCGGSLAQNGLLDQAKLEEVLSRRPSRIDSPTAVLRTCVHAEAWLRSVSGITSHRFR